MRSFRRFGPVWGLAVLVGCERSGSPVPVDSAAIRAARAADSAAIEASPTRNWDWNAGPVLLAPAASAAQAFVVVPDSARADEQLDAVPEPAAATLFGRNGTVQTAELSELSIEPCTASQLTAAPPPRPWNVGFIGGVVAPVAVDSLGSIPANDSTQLIASVTRLASALPNDTAGRFAGLPFVVRSLWRFELSDSVDVVVATFTRQINQEATPLQERTLVVAERPSSDTTLTTAYFERSYGNEEIIESQDLLAAVLIGSARTPALVIAHDFGDAVSYGLLERVENARWRSRWLSARLHCGSAGVDSR